MSLTIPQILAISPFDSTQSHTINFQVLSGDQCTGNILTVYNNSNNAVVFTNTISSLILSHIIPANSLVNGTTYKCTIQTKNALNQTSNASSSIVFKCLSPAIITFTNIVSGKVYNQNVTFSATYSQNQSELLQQYEYFIFDSNKILIQSYPVQYADGSQPLTQLIENLENNVVYYVQILSISINGQSSDSGYIQFTPNFIVPLLNATLITQNVKETGSVLIQSNIVQLIGTMTSGTPTYTNSTWIDLSNSQVTFDTGFSLPQDNFCLKLWCKNLPNDVILLTLNSTYGKIEFQIFGNQLHAMRFSNTSSVLAHFASNALVIGNNIPFLVYVKSVGGLMDLSLTLT